jgi:polysaccharide deacetylase 2 family uncharacterized protein YibQ
MSDDPLRGIDYSERVKPLMQKMVLLDQERTEEIASLRQQLRGAVEAAREQIKALIMAQSAAGYVETAGWALLLDEIDKLPTPGGQ